jgi:hypothetical protein
MNEDNPPLVLPNGYVYSTKVSSHLLVYNDHCSAFFPRQCFSSVKVSLNPIGYRWVGLGADGKEQPRLYHMPKKWRRL